MFEPEEYSCSSTNDNSDVLNVLADTKQDSVSIKATRRDIKSRVKKNKSLKKNHDSVDVDGRLYDKQRDPPGQKCVYILPGNTEKETYRVGTFLKFPEEVSLVINVCLLARCGFYYTGYKDRVKCFSCGSTPYDWKVTDVENDRRWHYYECPLVEGKENRNVTIMNKKPQFTGSYVSSFPSLDSGYGSGSFSCGLESGYRDVAVMKNDVPPIAADSLATTSSSEIALSNGIKEIKIGNPNSQSIPQQTARVVETVKPRCVEGLEFASITSDSHRKFLTNDLDLHKEEDRKKSFSIWPHEFSDVTPDKLAASGFFYLGNSDRVQCFSCTGVLRNWNENDNVEQQHASHFPHCKMVLQLERRNIPSPETIMRLQNAKRSIKEPADPSPQEMENLKRQFPCLYPVNPHMKDFNARLQTFDQRWPSQKVNATPQHIAKAGFYFLGERDRAKCWYCNGGLQNWEPNDEPFTEHAKWFPGCEFVLQCKGVEFVKQIVSKFPNLRRPALRNPRFDHKTLKLIPEEPRRDQQQPLLVDPQANNSAGEVLRRYSPSTSRSQNQTNESKKSEAQLSKLEKKAIEMGFELPVVQKIIQKRIKETKKNFENINELIEALISCDDEPVQNMQDESKPQLIHMKPNFEENLHETQFQGEGVCLVAAGPSQSLKRSNEQRSEPEHSQKSSDVDTPMKRYKTGQSINKELSDLENQRNCKACKNEVANNVILPCGHLSLCDKCINTTKSCPVCNHKKQSCIKAYLV